MTRKTIAALEAEVAALTALSAKLADAGARLRLAKLKAKDRG